VTDWRDAILAGVRLESPQGPARNPLGRPGYEPRDAVRFGDATIAGVDVVVCVWDFTAYGGSYGEREAAAVSAAVGRAIESGRPLVSFARTGGTRLTEGMAALVGIARSALAFEDLAAAGVPHVAVVDQPTTGGVWVTLSSAADLRVGVAGATVGFTGPRVVEAMTGRALPEGSHTAESVHAAGLLDAVVPGEEVAAWLARALSALAPDAPAPVPAVRVEPPPARTGWEQVEASRTADRPSGAELLRSVLEGPVALQGADDTVAAAVGRLGGRRAVAVALGAQRAGRPTVAGYALLARAATVADHADAGLLLLVDCFGADPSAESERAGIAPGIAAGLRAVLGCRAPTVSVVHGEGGSGGALAAAVADRVGVAPYGWFAALAPEGAAAALRRGVEEATDAMAVTPADLLRLGFADEPAPGDAEPLAAWAAAAFDSLRAQPREERLAARRRRWAGPLPGILT
jgi:acetyl-CoA carboxylase carboxyl transferase subunit beta